MPEINYPIIRAEETEQRVSYEDEDLYFADRAMARDIYLLQKPACFMVVGNPSTGKTTLAKKLVQEMRCQYIHATELIEQNMRDNTLLGKYCAKQLLSGRTIANKTLVALLKDAISLPECQHYGYVMDSFPTYLAFEEQIELVENLPLKPDFVINIEIPDEDLRKRLESQRVDPINGAIYNYYNLEDPPGPLIKSAQSAASRPKPKTVVREKEEEQGLEMDDVLMEEGIIGEVNTEKGAKSWHPEFPRPTKEVAERLLLRPEDSQRELDKLFKLSRDTAQKSLEQFLRKFPRTHVIRIDGNCPPTQMFYNLMVKVKAMSIRPAIPPYHLLLKTEEEEEEEAEEPEREGEEKSVAEPASRALEEPGGDKALNEAEVDVDLEIKERETDWDEVISSLAVHKMPTEHSRWQLSEWQRFCPVQLYNGILEYGKSQFACGFLGYLYFLSCRTALRSFIRNPRPYLDFQIPQPKLTVRIAVVGFHKSGSATLCHLLADRHGAVCISLTELLRKDLDAQLEATLAKVKAEVEANMVEKLNNQRKREIEEIKTNNYADNASMKLAAETVSAVADEILENIVKSKAGEGEKYGLKEVITEEHPQVVEAVTRVLRFTKAQPNYLEPKRYVDTLVAELARLDRENRNILPSKRKPLSWVIEGLPPLEEVWQELKKRSRSVAKAVKYVRQACENVYKLERAMHRRELSKAAMEEGEEEEGEGSGKEEAMMEGEAVGGTEETVIKLPKSDESANPYAKKLDPRLVKAREVADEATARVIPLDPMPLYVFKMKDDLPDYALMIHRLYGVGFGPLEDLPALSKAEGIDESAIEPMVATGTSEKEPSKEKSDALHDEDDAVTEPPEDPPTSGQIYHPMPQPGPEVDCVRDQLVQFDRSWEASKQGLSTSTTAYGFPVHVQDLSIRKDKTFDNLLAEVNNEFGKLFKFTAKESSQEMLDEEAEAETEGFAETGGLEDNPALAATEGEEMEEGEEGEEEEGEEKEEVEGAIDENEEEVEEEMEAEEDASRSANRKLGQTSYFCPVAYRDYRVVKPGDPELVATYKGLAYYLGSEKDMAKFMANPEKYVTYGHQPPLKPPPLRIALLGPPGTGKTLHGRQIAGQLDLIHVSFDQMLQDVMMRKLKHRIGPEYEDDKEVPVKVMPNLEEAVAKALRQLENPKAAEEEAATAPPASTKVTDEGDAPSPDANLTPHELAIREFLENDEALPEASLNLLLPRLWHEEPYRSKGFILEGFPRSADDVTYLLEANLFVDFALVLNAEAENLLPRLLPVRLAKWKVRMAKIEANRKIVTDWKAQKRKRIREERRKTIIKSLSEKRITRFMRQTLDDVVTEMEDMEVDEDRDLDDEVNISEMLDEEIPEEEEEEAEDEETEGEATTRIEEEISDRVESVNANTEEVMEALTEAKIPHFSIRADDQLTRVRYRIVKKIKNLILNREALFERVYPITLEEGENLIASGFKHFSPFTRFCPISWDRVSIARLPPLNPSPLLRYSRLDRRLVEPQLGDSIAPDTPIGKGKKGSASGVQTCCAVYRECVYWFASEVERKVFMTNPIAAIRRAGEQTRTLVHQPLEVAVTGGPTSQREFISKRLGTDLHVVHVTTTAAVQWLLSSVSQSWTSLAQQIREVIMSGAALCDDLVAKALRVALLAPQIQARGYVLDNYPITVDQAKFMHASSIRPFLMLELHSKHCNHPSIEVSWFDNWNNQEPPDCPFLKVWLNMKARRGRSLGAGLGGLADGIDGFGGAGRGRGAGGAGLGGEGFGEDGRGRRGGGGSDEDDGFGGGGRGGGGGGGRRGGGGGGVGSSRDGAGGRGGPGSGLSGSESEGQGGRRKGGADGSSGSRDGLGGRGGRGGRYGSGGSEDGSDRDGFGRGGKGRGGRRGGLGRDGEWDESDGEGGFGRRRGRGAKYGDDDEYSDGEGGRGGRGRGRRRGRGSGGSSDESDGEGRHGRGRHGRRGRHRRRRGSDDSYDEDDSRGGGRRRRRHRGRRDGSDDSDGSGRRGRRRRGRHGSGGSSEDEDDDYSRYGKGGKGGRDGSSGESDEEAEWKKRRHRRIDEPLEKRYGIPSAETDRMPDEILKHFAYVDAESARRSWLKSHSGTLTDISAEDSALVALKKALLTTTHRMAHVMEYEANRRRSRPMSVSEMGLTMKQFDKNIGEFGHYCPVRLAENDELFDCREEHTAPLVTRLPGAESCLPNARYNSAFGSTSLRYIVDILDVDLHPHIPTDLRFAVEFNGKMYRTAGPEELRKFMANPEKYLPPQVPKGLPEENDLPKKLPAGTIPRDSFPRQIALRGFCPVCFHESGQHYEGLREGDANILALYKGQIYAFCSEECRNKFMHHPWLYADLKLPNKLPPMKVPISVDELPLPGYLEQTVAYVLRNALAMCSKFRPKYPFITPERSALIYMALQLKALNPRTPEYLRFRAKSRVERFERACQLIDQLTAIMPVDYQAECQRSETLSRQLHEFLSLQNQVDNEDRWIYSI